MSQLATTDELSEFLGQLAGAGSMDSRGHFTLDIEKARDKLRRFQLPTPHHFVLCLLSSACSAGARTLQLQSDGLDTIGQFDGRSFAFDDFKDLFGAFLTPASHDPFRVAVRELAMAVHGARGLDPEFICVESWGDNRGARLFIRGNTMEVEPLKETPFADAGHHTLMHVRERGGWFATLRILISQMRGVASAPEKILTNAARYAETAVRVRGIGVNVPKLGNWPAVSRLNAQGPVRSPELAPKKSTYNRPLQLDVPFSGYLGFGDGLGGTLVIVSGVLFQPALALSYTTARVIAYAPYLSKDLSQTQLLQDEGYARFVTQLDEALDRLVVDIVDAGMALADWMEQPLKEYLARRVSLEELPAPVREAHLVPLANQQTISLNAISQSYQKHRRVAWMDPPGYPRNHDSKMPDGTLVLLRTPLWGETIDRLFPYQGPSPS